MTVTTNRAQVGDVIQSDALKFGVLPLRPKSGDEAVLVGRKDDFFQPGEEKPVVDEGRSERQYKVLAAENKNMGGALSWPSSWIVVAQECDTEGRVVPSGEKIQFSMSGAVTNLVEEVTLVSGHRD